MSAAHNETIATNSASGPLPTLTEALVCQYFVSQQVQNRFGTVSVSELF